MVSLGKPMNQIHDNLLQILLKITNITFRMNSMHIWTQAVDCLYESVIELTH